jgi:omega-6 fatty acid desaturase (delta-12 desaturase)
LFGPGAALLFLFFQRFSSKGAGKRERNSVVFTNLALLVVIAVASLTVGFQTYVLIQLPVIVIGGAVGLWLFYVQHQFENMYWARHEVWDPLRVALEGSSYFTENSPVVHGQHWSASHSSRSAQHSQLQPATVLR